MSNNNYQNPKGIVLGDGDGEHYDKNILYKIFKGLRIFKKNISESVANDWERGWPLGQQC